MVNRSRRIDDYAGPYGMCRSHLMRHGAGTWCGPDSHLGYISYMPWAPPLPSLLYSTYAGFEERVLPHVLLTEVILDLPKT